MSALKDTITRIITTTLVKYPYVILGLLIVLLYIPSLTNGFVWDDHFVVVHNDFIKSASNLKLIFTKQYLTAASDMSLVGVKDIGSGESSYRPMVTLSFFLDYAIWKLKPFGYHLHNLLLHGGNSLFVFFLIVHLGMNTRTAFISALLFAWHPLHMEAVGGIANRDDLVCMFYAMASFLIYIRLDSLRGIGRQAAYTCSLICLALALLAKEMAFIFPFLFMLCDLCFTYQGRVKACFLKRRYLYSGYVVLLIVYGILRFWILRNAYAPHGELLGGQIYTHILSVFHIVATYLRWLWLPLGIHTVIQEDASFFIQSFFSSEAILSIGFTISFLFLAFKLRSSKPQYTFAILWFFMALIPVLNIIPLQNFIAVRYAYIPSVGICLFLSLLLNKALEAAQAGPLLKKTGVYLLLGGILSLYGLMSLHLMRAWKDDLFFGLELARYYPDSARIRCILGTYYYMGGEPQKAKREYDITLRLDPTYGKGYLCRGIYYEAQGDQDKALADYQKAQALDPLLWHTHFYLGNMYLRKNLYDQAFREYAKLLTFAPRHTAAYNNLGVIYLSRGQVSKAKKMWETTLEIDEDNAFALMHLNRLPQPFIYSEGK